MPFCRRTFRILRTCALILAIIVQGSCLSILALNEEGSRSQEFGFLGLLGLFGQHPGGGYEGPSSAQLSSEPQVTLPGGGPDGSVAVQVSDRAAPDVITQKVPIGAPYSITLDPSKIDGLEAEDVGPGTTVRFPEGQYAELKYTYEPALLNEAGFTEDFQVYYFDEYTNAWRPVDRLVVDAETRTITAYTSHFTTFVLTAMPASTGTVVDAPSCIGDDFPGGIGGTAGAQFTVVDANFKYYQDRNYYIQANADFADLGFAGALGIATCNGGSPCGPQNAHKLYTGGSYIDFTAHAPLDVYVMYDSRGGTGPGDTSQDAPWLAARGFVDTGRFIETTDAVGTYTVYRRAYNVGEQIVLDGNRAGVTDGGINTNYWVVLKPAGVTTTQPASMLCSQTDGDPPGNVTDLIAAPGQNGVMLRWANPIDADFAGVVIRRSTLGPPANPTEGVAPTGVQHHPNAYEDQGLTVGTTYMYTVFALDENQNYGTGTTVVATTSPDLDGDGLSDAFETTTNYYSGPAPHVHKTDAALADTDADGIDDGQEFLNGTYPLDPDTYEPTVSSYSLLSPSPTTVPNALFIFDDFEAAYYMFTTTNTRPQSVDSRWQPRSGTPGYGYELPGKGSHDVYVWIKDGAGNVSLPRPPITVQVDRLQIPVTLYASGSSSKDLRAVSLDPATGAPSAALQTIGLGGQHSEWDSLELHPSGRYLYARSQETFGNTRGYIRVFERQNDGTLTTVQDFWYNVADNYDHAQIYMHPSGDFLYLYYQRGVQILNIASDGRLSYYAQVAMNPAGLGRSNMILSRDGSRLIRSYVEQGPALPPTFIPLPGDAIIAVYSIDANGYPALRASTSLGGGLNYGPHLAITPDGQYVYAGSGSVRGFRLNGDGTLTDLGVSGTGWDVSVHPGGGFLYGRETGQVYVYAIGTDGSLTSRGSHSVCGNRTHAPVFDRSGNYAYFAGDRDSCTGRTSVYHVGGAPGLEGFLYYAGEAVTDTATKNVVVYSEESDNDAPLVRLERPIHEYFDGQRLQPRHQGYFRIENVGWFRALANDADAARCNADPANYQTQLTLVSKPAASAMTQADISIGASWLDFDLQDPVTGNFRVGASYLREVGVGFVHADVPGEYEFDFSFTDDPGTCDGPAVTVTKRLRLTAATWRSQGPFLEPSPGSVPPLPPGGVKGYDYRFVGNGTYRKHRYVRLTMKRFHKTCYFVLFACDTWVTDTCTTPGYISETVAKDYCRRRLPSTTDVRNWYIVNNEAWYQITDYDERARYRHLYWE